ncbi:MAG: nucleotidyltransferase [Candidatus Omnitrophica bacterium]|nr:nucleotidyltransferase [Candidatus Omnitrophota bacterium]
MDILKKQLKDTVKFLASLDIDYAIIGGVAVSLYGVPRFTADVDINIILEKERIGIFLREAKKYGLYPAHTDIEKIAKNSGVIPMRYSKRGNVGLCDFIIAENIIEKLTLRRAKVKKIDSLKAKFATPEDIIIHKLASPRPQDAEDVRNIILRKRGKLNVGYVKLWLARIDRANKGSRLLDSFNNLLD